MGPGVNILMHCLYFPPEVGGLESHVFYLCRALAGRGHTVRMVTSRSLPDAPAREVMDGVEVWRTWFPMRNPVGWGLHALGSMTRLRSLAAEADVLHAQTFQSVPPALWARRGRDIPLVTTYHTSHFLARAGSGAWKPVLGALVRAADHNLAASREIAEVAGRLAPGVPVEALTNGVETEVFRPVAPTLAPTERRRVVVPRRLFPKNGVEYFVRALPRIVERLDVEAVVVGDGPERERLELLARELGVAERLRFLGARPHSEMPGLLSSCEAAVFPSLMEATSVAALEAMACRVPVAASRVGGLPEIVDHEVGVLFEPADPESLAVALVELLTSDDLEARGRRARERVVERWSNERLARRHLEVYESLLENPRGGGA